MKNNIYTVLEPKILPEIIGNGKKGVIIVIHATDKNENLSTLQGLVQAIKLDIQEDVTIVSCVGERTDINSILSKKDYNTVILIGVTPEQVGFSLNAKKYFFYKMERFTLLLTDSLQVMNSDKSKKMAFWKNLQARFLS